MFYIVYTKKKRIKKIWERLVPNRRLGVHFRKKFSTSFSRYFDYKIRWKYHQKFRHKILTRGHLMRFLFFLQEMVKKRKKQRFGSDHSQPGGYELKQIFRKSFFECLFFKQYPKKFVYLLVTRYFVTKYIFCNKNLQKKTKSFSKNVCCNDFLFFKSKLQNLLKNVCF